MKEMIRITLVLHSIVYSDYYYALGIDQLFDALISVAKTIIATSSAVVTLYLISVSSSSSSFASVVLHLHFSVSVGLL